MKITKDFILNEIKNEILSLKILPGDPISEATLTSRYNLSRTPIREILKALEREGYINISPQKSSRVSLINLELVDQVVFLRSTLETQIVKDLCGKLDLKSIESLRNILDSQKNFITQKYPIEKFIELDNNFHKALFIFAGREYLWDIIDSLKVHYIRYRRLHMGKNEKISEIYNEHVNLLNMIISADFYKIDEIISKHIISDVKSDYFIKNFPNYIGSIQKKTI